MAQYQTVLHLHGGRAADPNQMLYPPNGDTRGAKETLEDV